MILFIHLNVSLTCPIFQATSEGKHITPGLLSVLHKQLQGDTTVPINELKAKWAQLSLPGDRLDMIGNKQFFRKVAHSPCSSGSW